MANCSTAFGTVKVEAKDRALAKKQQHLSMKSALVFVITSLLMQKTAQSQQITVLNVYLQPVVVGTLRTIQRIWDTRLRTVPKNAKILLMNWKDMSSP